MDDLPGIASTLRDRLLAALYFDPDFRSFAADSRRTMGTPFFNYPAMMVPQVQERLLDAWIASDPDHKVVLRPFRWLGDGHDRGDAARPRLSWRRHQPAGDPAAEGQGTAIRSRRHSPRTLANILTAVDRDRRTSKLNFRGREKWFSDPVAVQPTRLHRGIAALRWPGCSAVLLGVPSRDSKASQQLSHVNLQAPHVLDRRFRVAHSRHARGVQGRGEREHHAGDRPASSARRFPAADSKWSLHGTNPASVG